ncbi:MAG TPA: ABC transporter substrate-binding protein [Chryseosolibacter sp.]|nr:ABC transporter substrate-binding protein [Chryseosolibacter sp.]
MKFYLLAFCIASFGCSPRNDERAKSNPQSDIEIKYATGFKVTAVGNSKLVEVTYPYQGATSGYKYLLVPRGKDIPEHEENVKTIRTPVSSIVCTSTTHIPLLDYIGETKALVGFPTTDYISSEKMRERIDRGEVKDLGVDKSLNIEKLVSLRPALTMGYTMTSDYGQFKKIEEFDIPVVINAEYLEKHPLGRAEWIKFMALFFDKSLKADSVFRAIEKNYLHVKTLADSVESRPTVMSGVVYGDAWFMPGGQNYAAKLMKDAGCNYLWADDSSHGFLQLGFEKVYEKANNADLWIGVGLLKTLDEIRAVDERYAKFKPFKEKHVYSSDARLGAKGGSEALELGYLRPDIMISDLVEIAHPHLIDHELYFHKKLQ